MTPKPHPFDDHKIEFTFSAPNDAKKISWCCLEPGHAAHRGIVMPKSFKKCQAIFTGHGTHDIPQDIQDKFNGSRNLSLMSNGGLKRLREAEIARGTSGVPAPARPAKKKPYDVQDE